MSTQVYMGSSITLTKKKELKTDAYVKFMYLKRKTLAIVEINENILKFIREIDIINSVSKKFEMDVIFDTPTVFDSNKKKIEINKTYTGKRCKCRVLIQSKRKISKNLETWTKYEVSQIMCMDNGIELSSEDEEEECRL